MALIVAPLQLQRKLAESTTSPRLADLSARTRTSACGTYTRWTSLLALLMCCLPAAAFGAVLQEKAVLNTDRLDNLSGAGSVARIAHVAATAVTATSTLSVSTTGIAFGNVAVNATVAHSITLKSSGTAAVTINSAVLSGTGFSVSGVSFPLTLTPGQTAKLTVTFHPTSLGATSGQISLASNSSTSAIAPINLSGTGIVILSKLTCVNYSLTGAGQDGCTAWLNTPAPSGGFVVNIASNNPSVTPPASATVSAGATMVGFWVPF